MARVLVVDDEPDIRRLMHLFLEKDGHEVLEAANTMEAELALERAPDCIFLDVSMPGESGREFLLRLRHDSQLSRTPVMFVTAHADQIVEVQGRGLAGPHVITKPFRREQISEAVQAMLRAARRRLDARVRVIKNALRVTVDSESPAVAKNLSIGGVYVLARHKRPIGDPAKLRLHLNGRTVETGGRVTHCGRDGIGFAFVKPSLEMMNLIAAAIDDLLTDGAGFDDRRQSLRVAVSGAVAFGDGKDRTLAELRDLSKTGAYLVTPDPPQCGTRIYVYLPGYAFAEGTRERREVRGCLAEVVRRGDDGFGCRFLDVTAEFNMAIDDLMTSQGRQELVGM